MPQILHCEYEISLVLVLDCLYNDSKPVNPPNSSVSEAQGHTDFEWYLERPRSIFLFILRLIRKSCSSHMSGS
jgi:hypothetical protein